MCFFYCSYAKVGEALLYNGTDVFHSIAPQKQDCKRLVAIVPLYETLDMSVYGKYRRFVRDLTYKLLTI